MTVPINIIYLFGAGASAQLKEEDKVSRMPLANNFDKIIFSKFGNNHIRLIFSLLQIQNIDNIGIPLEEFAIFVSGHNSIDEAMKKLYINDDVKTFSKYKNLISVLFYLIESIDAFRDTRYSQLLLTLIGKNFKLPPNIKMFSWNYDNQLEHAANEIKTNNINEITLSTDNYHKINGTATRMPRLNLNPNEMNTKTENMEKAIANFHSLLNDESKIKFAWEQEENNEGNTMLENLNNFIENGNMINCRNYLVAIGYSFPTVNHIYDLEILKALKPERIYIQNKLDITSSIEERFYGLFYDSNSEPNKDRYKYIQDYSRFYIPSEYHDSSRPEIWGDKT